MWLLNFWRLVLFATILFPGFAQVQFGCCGGSMRMAVACKPHPVYGARRMFDPQARSPSTLQGCMLTTQYITSTDPLTNPSLAILQMIVFYFFSPRLLRSIAFGSKPRNRLDVFVPRRRWQRQGPLPTVIFITGGAWTIGYKGKQKGV